MDEGPHKNSVPLDLFICTLYPSEPKERKKEKNIAMVDKI